MRIGLAQINPTVGDLSGNRNLIIKAYQELVRDGAELIVFPELATCGYPPRDLLFKSRFGHDNECALLEIAAQVGTVPALIGTLERNPAKRGRPFFNAAAWCQDGGVQRFARKSLLPTYDVFDEDRYFEASPHSTVVSFQGFRIGITICEDIWADSQLLRYKLYNRDPISQLADESVDLMINLSASPWCDGKDTARQGLVTSAASRLQCPVIYVNMVGGNDELVFDGRSMVVDRKGEKVAELRGFETDQAVINIAGAKPLVSGDMDALADVNQALVLGLRDYAHKSGFKHTLVALSGGIDSAVVAVLACSAFGAENVRGISLPSRISSQHSKDDAQKLARNLGMAFDTIPIADTVSACETAVQPLFSHRAPDVTEENIQARIRGVIMMALSNKLGSLLLTTGNKSEIAVGYCTLYGDMCGGLAVLSDVFKTRVYELARWINRNEEIIPWNTIEKPPSAELRPDQKDEDSLPPYDQLDAILRAYIEDGLSRREIVDQGFAPEVVADIVRKVDLNEYKRQQAAPGLKITSLAFGVGRRIPIVQKYVN